jgi:hypothetical protein
MENALKIMPKAFEFKGKKPEMNPEDFEPTYKVAWLIGNEKYDKVLVNGKNVLADVPQSKTDV